MRFLSWICLVTALVAIPVVERVFAGAAGSCSSDADCGPGGKCGGTQLLSQTSKSNLLEWTKAGAGLKAAKELQKVEVEVLEVRGNIATAKAVSGEFVEYMHLVRTGEKWQIVNILWTPAKPSKP